MSFMSYTTPTTQCNVLRAALMTRWPQSEKGQSSKTGKPGPALTGSPSWRALYNLSLSSRLGPLLHFCNFRKIDLGSLVCQLAAQRTPPRPRTIAEPGELKGGATLHYTSRTDAHVAGQWRQLHACYAETAAHVEKGKSKRARRCPATPSLRLAINQAPPASQKTHSLVWCDFSRNVIPDRFQTWSHGQVDYLSPFPAWSPGSADRSQ